MSKGEFSRKIVCTQTIVDTMLKDSPPAIRSTHRTHRTYAPEFRAQLVAACQQRGVSIAALAGQHGMNANVANFAQPAKNVKLASLRESEPKWGHIRILVLAIKYCLTPLWFALLRITPAATPSP